MQALGHDVIEIAPPYGKAAYDLFFEFLVMDHGGYCRQLLEGEEVDHCNLFYSSVAQVPAELREMAKPYLTPIVGDHAANLTSK